MFVSCQKTPSKVRNWRLAFVLLEALSSRLYRSPSFIATLPIKRERSIKHIALQSELEHLSNAALTVLILF